MTQYYSRKDYEYAGDSNFTIPFSYIDKDDINVYVNDEAITTFTWLNNSQINVTSTLATGDIISIRRNTPIDEKIVTYQNMSMVLSDDNLNLSQDQVLNAVQEIYDNNVTFEIKVNNDIDEIETTANTALSNSQTAITTANNAETKANNAVSTANSANSKADNAVSTANTASNNATTAVNTANSAVNTANSASNTATAASNKVDAFGEDISAVIEAAEKIDELEEAVQTAVDAATTAGDKATIASNKATEATNAANRAEAAIPTQTGQNGKFLSTNGTNTSWETIIIPEIDIDNKSITENSNDELQTVGVIDSNNTSNAIKTWTGTRTQYDAITTKDTNTLYNIIDDTDVTLTLLNALYPIGSIYIGTMANCPLATLGVGTWQLVATDRVLQGATDGSAVGTTVEAGLPNITGTFCGGDTAIATGAFTSLGNNSSPVGSGSSRFKSFDFDASRSSSIYGNSTTVQPPAYLVNIWERVS